MTLALFINVLIIIIIIIIIMCGLDFLFQFGFFKNSDLVRNEFGLV